MDRGIPTEETLEQMRASDPPVSYLVGTPKGRLSQLEKKLTELPWQQVREGINVKLLAQQGECMCLRRADRESTRNGPCAVGNSRRCGSVCRNCAR